MLNALRSTLFDSSDYVLYRFVGDGRRLQSDTGVVTYYDWTHVEEEVRRVMFGSGFFHPLLHRLRRGRAQLLTLTFDGELVAYGWVQDWQAFRGKFGWLERDAVMLGPYWTHPDHRGKRLYGRMLNASLLLGLQRQCPLIIYTTPSNTASQKGIERFDFDRLGTFRVSTIARRCIGNVKVD